MTQIPGLSSTTPTLLIAALSSSSFSLLLATSHKLSGVDFKTLTMPFRMRHRSGATSPLLVMTVCASYRFTSILLTMFSSCEWEKSLKAGHLCTIFIFCSLMKT
eukprot:CAMPEP_0182512394 /NCGR_PEP_ID=MMETSP1321-20130603/32104_1 /TAXON_ID=91990 /ORGANISM="Bolidomonas sp., Strain RCC1657" /LENGTH=103 /DNA_ID=CAMNT_0024719207 /DNA_START=30 /DNA_END=337 /DNA_ORIENTATION=-